MVSHLRISAITFSDNMADEAIASHYQVLEELGRGSFGVVYKGIEKATGQVVAIKHVSLAWTTANDSCYV